MRVSRSSTPPRCPHTPDPIPCDIESTSSSCSGSDSDDSSGRDSSGDNDRIRVEVHYDGSGPAVQVRHRDGDDARTVFASRRQDLQRMQEKIAVADLGALGAVVAVLRENVQRKIDFEGPHESFETDEGYIAACAIADLDKLCTLIRVTTEHAARCCRSVRCTYETEHSAVTASVKRRLAAAEACRGTRKRPPEEGEGPAQA